MNAKKVGIITSKFDYKRNINYNNLISNFSYDYYSINYIKLFDNEYYSNEIFSISLLLSQYNLSKFKFFFKNLYIDVPFVLNKVPSLKRLHGKTELYQLNQFLIKKGNRLNSLRLLQNFFFKYLVSDIYFDKNLYNWKTCFTMLTSNFTSNLNNNLNNNIYNLTSFSKKKLNMNNKIINNFIYYNNEHSYKNLLKESFKKFNLIFSFYIYKVDKSIYKNSRGKSGKYTFIWKYIPSYKRSRLIYYWLAKEVKIHSAKTLQNRLNSTLLNFFKTITNTWIWKIKKFSLNYIFYKLRKSLAENYRTSVK